MAKEVHINGIIGAHLRGLNQTAQHAQAKLLEAAGSARMTLGLCDKIQLNLEQMVFFCPEERAACCSQCEGKT